MDKNLAATHEAGHAVVQWLVGWEVQGLKMKVAGSDATDVHAVCPYERVKTLSEIRKRLLVLFAGNAATWRDWPETYNNAGDWNDIRHAMALHIPRTLVWAPGDEKPFRDDEANELVESAKAMCDQVVEHATTRSAIDQLARLFFSAAPDAEGHVWLPGSEAVELCERIISKEFQSSNPWSGWLAGQ